MHCTRFSLSTWLLALLLLILSAPLTAATVKGKVVGGKQFEHPGWFKESFLDIADDVDEATEAGKHVLLFMHLNGCPYCFRMADENFMGGPRTDFIQANFDVIELNIKGDREIAFNEEVSVTEKELARHLKVRYTPTVVFLNKENNKVLQLNGYRSPRDFAHALNYVREKAYLKTTLSKYIETHPSQQQYLLRDHPQLKSVTDLQSVGDQPLAILFEDSNCDLCDQLHDGHLQRASVREILKGFTFVRLDAHSEEEIIDPLGNKTTPRAFAEQLKLNYRPGIVLYDKGREVSRIDGLLYSYHFEETLRYVSERHYEKYPKSFYDYLDVRTEQLLSQGVTVDLSK